MVYYNLGLYSVMSVSPSAAVTYLDFGVTRDLYHYTVAM